MGKTLSGKIVAEEVLGELKKEVSALGRKPLLAIVLVGEDDASKLYVKMKMKKAEYVGVEGRLHTLPADVSEKRLLSLVEKLNNDESVDGFIVQAPLPKQINQQKIMEAISPAKDVDGWTSTNMGRLFVGMKEGLLPATPAGVMRILEYYNIETKGKNAVVIGRSNVVGKPAAMLLLQRNATVTICHSRTKSLEEHTKNADIIVAAAGVPGLVKGSMVKEGTAVVDVGTTKVGNRTVGDVVFDEVIKKADCSPVPGGVGPMTVAMLLRNVVLAARKRG